MQEFSRHLLISLKANSLYICIFMFIVSFAESFAFLGLIVPGAVFVIGAGFLAYEGYFNIYVLIISAIFGAVSADIVSYYIDRWYYISIIKTTMYRKYKNYFDTGEIFFNKHGGKSIFLGRFVGILRPIVPFIAGMLKMKKLNFFVWAVTSGILWGITYIGVGYLFGRSLDIVNRWTDRIDYILLASVAVFITVYLIEKRGKWNT